MYIAVIILLFALGVTAVFCVYPGIRAAEYLGGDEFVEWNPEDWCPRYAGAVVCQLHDPRVAVADVSSSQQKCYYYG